MKEGAMDRLFRAALRARARLGLLWLDVTAEDIRKAESVRWRYPCPLKIAALRRWPSVPVVYVGNERVYLEYDPATALVLTGGAEQVAFTLAYDRKQAVYPTRIKLHVA